MLSATGNARAVSAYTHTQHTMQPALTPRPLAVARATPHAAPTRPPPPTTRRDLLAAGLVAALVAQTPSARAEEAVAVAVPPPSANSLPPYTLTVPPSWTQAIEAPAPRSPFAPATSPTMLRVWYPSAEPTPDAANVAVKQAFASADYTSLGSFGTALAFGETLVSGMDRSAAGPGAPAARLVSAAPAVRGGADVYEITYDVRRAGEDTWRRCYSVVALAADARGYNMFYTVTGQVAAGGEKEYGDVVKKVVKSFVPPSTK